MKVENNNYQSAYKTTNTGAANSGKFKDAIAEFMKPGSAPATTSSRQTDTFERTSPATESGETAEVAESKAPAKADEITMTQEQIDMLSEKYDPSDFYYVNPFGEISFRLWGTGGSGKVENFYQDLKGMGFLSERDYTALRYRETLDTRIGLRNVDTGEWITPEYFGREFLKESIDKYGGEEEARIQLVKIMRGDDGFAQGMSGAFTKLAGIFQEVFYAESADESDMLIQACMKGAERWKEVKD